MKMKIIRQAPLLMTIVITGLVAFVLFSGKAIAYNKSKLSRFRSKHSSVSKSGSHKASTEKSEHNQTEFPDDSDLIESILSSTTGLKPQVLKLGLKGYQWAKQHDKVTKPYLTIVDFTKPSKEKRMWVINLNNHKVIMKTLVANGKGSGLYKGIRFSNTPRSLQSSLGVYVTGTPYYGSDGLSLHVKGLQPGVNSNAYHRLIEFHGANYVSPSFAKHYGRVGRSWGCFALNKAVLPKVVNTIENGSVVFAYAEGHNKDYAPYAG